MTPSDRELSLQDKVKQNPVHEKTSSWFLEERR